MNHFKATRSPSFSGIGHRPQGRVSLLRVFFIAVSLSLLITGCGKTGAGSTSEKAARNTGSPSVQNPEKNSTREETGSPDEDSPKTSSAKKSSAKKDSEKTDSAKKDSEKTDSAKAASSGKTAQKDRDKSKSSSSQADSQADVQTDSQADAQTDAKEGTGNTGSKSGKKSSRKPADNSADSISSENSAAPSRRLKYIDAWKEWHVMEVDPSVRKNDYDSGKWTGKDGRMTLDDDRFEVWQGIDVSEHQGTVDWKAVAEAGFRFAFIRVGYRGYGEEGHLMKDAMAAENLRKASAAGLHVGTYIFSQALNEEEAREEAALAMEVIAESGVETDLPLMYDPELIRDDQGRANGITREQVVLNTAAFEDEVEKSSGLKADIYSNLPWEHHYFVAETMNRYQIWYADYEKIPQTPYHFTWWQYTNEGYAPGVEGPVDLNLWIRPKKAGK